MDISSMIEAGGHVKFEVSGEDLRHFAEQVIEKAAQLVARPTEPQKEKWLTQKEAMQLCRVSKTTLWEWGRRGYLVPSKLGNRNMYLLSAIERILNSRQSE